MNEIDTARENFSKNVHLLFIIQSSLLPSRRRSIRSLCPPGRQGGEPQEDLANAGRLSRVLRYHPGTSTETIPPELAVKLRDRLAQRQLIVVTGKGRVGKTAVTAALARSLARSGRQVLALEVDPRENLHQLFDVPPSGGAVVEVTLRLFLQNLKPRTVVDWIVERQVMIARRILQSPIYHRFSELGPRSPNAGSGGEGARSEDLAPRDTPAPPGQRHRRGQPAPAPAHDSRPRGGGRLQARFHKS